ncbi:MAG: transporter substrate-binding domain-containing protein [Beijerinckiaceae bacterium]
MRRLAGALLLAAALSAGQAGAQAPDPDNPFFDLARKPEKAELTGQRVIRFLTDDDYPPFHFVGADGQLAGFNIDLARALCAELKAACTIQPRRWGTLLQALEEGRGDAVIASFTGSAATRGRFETSVPYYRTPARFAARKAGPEAQPTPATLAGKTVAVVGGSAHAAFLAAFFPKAEQKSYRDLDEALKALGSGEAAFVFGDGVGIAVWLNGQSGAACCAFLGGPFYESRYFGEGAVIAFRKDGAQTRRAVDYALYRLAEQGIYQALLLKYFPVAFY